MARVDSQVSATANVTGSRRHPPNATTATTNTSRGAACKHTELRGRQAQGMKRARRDPESASCRVPPADMQASKGTARPRTAHRRCNTHARNPAERTAQTRTPLQPPSCTRLTRQGKSTNRAGCHQPQATETTPGALRKNTTAKPAEIKAPPVALPQHTARPLGHWTPAAKDDQATRQATKPQALHARRQSLATTPKT